MSNVSLAFEKNELIGTHKGILEKKTWDVLIILVRFSPSQEMISLLGILQSCGSWEVRP